MNIQDKQWYKAWRRSEAYMLPMTQEDIHKAEERAESFRKGFEAGLRHAVCRLEWEHSKVKKEHSFFLKASQFIRKII